MSQTQEATQTNEQNNVQGNGQEGVNPFGTTSWSEQLPTQPETKEETGGQPPATATTTPAAATEKENEEILGVNEWLKREYGWETEEAAKAEITELRNLKTNPPKSDELKFENEDSKIVHELIRSGKINEAVDVINKQKDIASAIALDVNKNTAVDIIKLNMKLKFPTLTTDQIDFQYKQEYGIPKEPVFNDAKETEDEFNERHNEWKEQVGNIEMKRTIAATMAKPELEKAKAEIKFPELPKPQTQNNEPTAEQAVAMQKFRENFIHKLESDFSNVKGFSTQVKNELVDFPVEFNIPAEEITAIKTRLEKEGMNVEEYVFSRWGGENGNWNIERMLSDIYVWENRDKILSGVANNAANKMFETYQKLTKNPDVKNTFQQTFHPLQQNNTGISPFRETAWSDKLPAPTA